ncbi:LOW QUALITY PROTEIN: 2-oxoglutarate receptor 1-like [Alosa alosa]|uniref:LOW QUALITY PROTEIN: 2-oxoglutarate receptor 1-like n=1 Tax=Alosa alosa TaxID=278164 RepID=UPI0020150CA1|nr:LOW QUALITY PROTEIN: 2-oxoglutarate receptor 1-like [Alosa alosa]
MAYVIYHGNSSEGNCTDVDQLMKRYYLPVMYGLIFIVGLVGNVTSLLVYFTKLRPWRSSSVIMVNLASTDLLYVCSMPFLVYYYTRGDSWTLGSFMCRFVRFGFHFNLYGSILFLTCLAIFRYVAVVHPLLASEIQRARWGVLACVAVWVFAAAQIAPMLTMITMVEFNNKTYCLDFASNDPEQLWWYGWLLTVLGYLLPLVVVSRAATSASRQLASGSRTALKAMDVLAPRRLIAVVMVCFVVCFLPYHVLRVLRVHTRRRLDSPCLLDRWVHAVYIISRPLAALNTVFNLVLYTLAGDRFQVAFESLFKCQQCLPKAKKRINLAVISKATSNTPKETDTDSTR